MKKHIRQILYTSVALGMSLTAAAALDNTVASADTTAPAETQPTQTTSATNSAAPSQTKEQVIDPAALDQTEAQKQAQYQKAYEANYDLARKKFSSDGIPFMGGNGLGSFSTKPTSQFSPALAQKLYEANDARNEIITANPEGLRKNVQNFNYSLDMISNYTYKDGESATLPTPDYALPLRTAVKEVPQDDQFYIDWLDHEIKLLQGQPETYKAPAEYTDLVKQFKHIADYYGGDNVKLSDSDYTRFYDLPGFQDWDDITGHIVQLTMFPGDSEYDVKFYTPYMKHIIAQWDAKHETLQKEYAAKNNQPAEPVTNSEDQAAESTPTPVTTPAKSTAVQQKTPQTAPQPTKVTTMPTTTTSTVAVKSTILPSATPVSTVKQARLPQTGNQNGAVAAGFGLGLITLATMFGFGRKREF